MSSRNAAARAEVLRRIGAALADGASGQTIPRSYSTQLPPGSDRIALFCDRVLDYRASVTHTTPDRVGATIAEVLVSAGTVIIPHDLDPAWMPRAMTVVPDGAPTVSISQLDQADAVITAAAVGIAETGTIVLDAGPGQGRRAITLVPDVHVCVIRADQVVGTVPEAVRRLDPRRPQTWISGPSATSDIELDRVEGVHGPRTLHVVLLHPQ